MKRLLIHVEGETEETFVSEILAPHLRGCGYGIVAARLIGNARLRQHRSGISGWPNARKDITKHLWEDREAVSTTMVDYYGLPAKGTRAWPGRAEATKLAFSEKAAHVESALRADLNSTMDDRFDPRRFVPFVIMHEFEALLFSDCHAFSSGIGRPDLLSSLEKIRDQFASPEEIDDSPTTAPSKRIIALIPHYQKPILGTLAALEIGLEVIRRECPHFSEWLSRLEQVA
jgi:hypothetical protein